MMVPGAAPKNRHRYKRSSVFCAGKIIFDDGVIDCDVLNISAGGAQIRVVGDLEPPDSFSLRIEGFDEFNCEVVRRAGSKYGLAFHEPPDYLPSDRWLDQFPGRGLADDLAVGGGIHGIAGSTLSSRAVARAVRRSLALHRVLVAGGADDGAED